MSHQISPRNPAVVLRPHEHMRALLAVAVIAVGGLTATLVVLVSDDSERSTSSVGEVSSRGPAAPPARYDGGPEEGTADIAPSTPRPTQQQAFPGLSSKAPESPGAPADGRRYDGGPEEGTRGLAPAPAVPTPLEPRYDGGPEEGTRGLSPAPAVPTPLERRYDGGPEEGTRGPTQFGGSR